MTNLWITRISAGVVCAVLVWCLASARVAVPVAAAGSCEGLMSLKLPSTTITSAKVAPATLPDTKTIVADAPRRAVSLPESCRVAATLRPSSDSEIKMEIWMPVSNWNGKYQAVGNGAFNGNINEGALTTALARGYAASSTDTGHTGGGASWGLGHPEKVIDFGWRAVHETAVASKKIIASFYGNDPKFSYWNGCSAGGRQAMKAAQRFPADFNGIIAGAPGLDWTGRAAQAVRIAKRLEQNESARLGQAQRQLLHTAVVAACDLIDGVKDGVLENPKRCKFDPGVLECKGADAASCLTPPQVETARLIYSAAVNPKTKRAINGLEPGSELGWTDLGWTASARATGLDQFRFLVFGDPKWDLQKFNFESDIVLAEERNDSNQRARSESQAVHQPRRQADFVSRLERSADCACRRDPVPTIAWSRCQAAGTTCTNPIGCSWHPAWDTAAAAKDRTHSTCSRHWSGGSKAGMAPDQITASITRPTAMLDRSRPLCPYPQVAVYKGAGSTDDASNFACRVQ